MNNLPPNHFLNLQRPDVFAPTLAGTPDTSTLGAHDFDVDTRTGFMPPQPPLTRLPELWLPWEAALDDAITCRLQLAERPTLSEEDEKTSEAWRHSIRELPILPTDALKSSELLLRRAHHVLAWVMHFYVHTMPTAVCEIHIPPPITVPLLQVCAQLQLPPVLTYSDDVLYNWAFKTPPVSDVLFDPKAELHNLHCLTLLSGTHDEGSSIFRRRALSSAASERTRSCARSWTRRLSGTRIASYLRLLAAVIHDMQALLAAVREGCDPNVFYHEIRPWFKGADSDSTGRKWVFDGLELDPTLEAPRELSGPSAGQSSLIHALDVFLGVDRYSHSNLSISQFHTCATPPPAPPVDEEPPAWTAASQSSSAPARPTVPFLTRMQRSMPRHHRTFLRHLQASPRPLRALVEQAGCAELTEAYDGAVSALKDFRDEHVRIVALYIVIPSRHAQIAKGKAVGEGAPNLKGTGGTDAFQFVKGVRDQTAGALLSRSEHS